MIEAATVLGVVLVAWVLLTSPVRTNYAVLVVVLALVPPLAHVPNGVTTQLFITRVLVIASGVGLAIRIRRGEAPGARFGGHPVFLIVGLSLAVALVNGVALVADVTNIGSSVQRFLLFVDQALVLVVVVALLRAIDDLVWAAKVMVIAFTGAAVIGIIENSTGVRPIAVIFGPTSPLLNTALTTRGGFQRPRGTFEFAQEFGLVLAFVAPLAIVWMAVRRRWWLGMGATGLIVVASLLTISRSAVLSLAVAAVILVVFSRSGSIRGLAVVGAVLVLVATAAFPDWWSAFSGTDTEASAEARFDRPPIVAELVVDHPWTGLGFSGIENELPATDNQYVLAYAEVGVIGVIAFATMWAGVVVAMAWGMRAPPSAERTILVGCVAGAFGGLVAAGTIDLFALGGSRVFWMLSALGLVIAERIAPPLDAAGRRRLIAPGLLAAGAAMVIGVIAIAVWPRSTAREFVFTTVSAGAEARAAAPLLDIGTEYANSVCDHSSVLDQGTGASYYCRTLRTSEGSGIMRIAASSEHALDQAIADEQSIGRLFRGFSLQPSGPVVDALPNGVRTAPIWLAALCLFLVWSPLLRPRTKRE